jgi:hypothetical protein
MKANVLEKYTSTNRYFKLDTMSYYLVQAIKSYTRLKN